MRLLFYAPPFDISARSLYQKLKGMKDVLHSEYIGSINGLIKHLRTPMGLSTIGMLWPSDREELSRLYLMRYLFRDMRIVLILPDHHHPTVSDGHLLRPRYVSYADGDMRDVAAVVRKMIASQGSPSALTAN